MNDQVYEEASGWLVEFRTEEVKAAARERFQAWLERSPDHVRAYLELAGIWETVSAADPADVATIDALIARARTADNVVPLEAKARPREMDATSGVQSAPRSSIVRLLAAAALATIAVIVVTGLYIQRGTYSTGVGEQRSILLPDGSTVDLNARSVVRVHYGEQARDIELLEGQALFRVSRDPARPFVVRSDGTAVRALGTQFDVNRRRRNTVVTVVEGTVAVSSTPARPAILVEAGQRAMVDAGRVNPPQHADVQTATAWTQRRLIFDSTPLEDVAEEFNRNNARPLVIESAGLENFHVSGAFSSSDPEALLRFLSVQQGIDINRQPDRIVVSWRR